MLKHYTMLLFAVANNQTALVTALLKHGASVTKGSVTWLRRRIANSKKPPSPSLGPKEAREGKERAKRER